MLESNKCMKLLYAHAFHRAKDFEAMLSEGSVQSAQLLARYTRQTAQQQAGSRSIGVVYFVGVQPNCPNYKPR